MNEEQGVGWAQKPDLLGGAVLIRCQYWLNGMERRLVEDYVGKACVGRELTVCCIYNCMWHFGLCN